MLRLCAHCRSVVYNSPQNSKFTACRGTARWIRDLHGCLPWTRCKSGRVWGVSNINIAGRWNLTFFSVAFSVDVPLVINSAKYLGTLSKRRLLQKSLLRCISMLKIWHDGCYRRHLFVVLPIYYLQVKLTAGYTRKVVTLLASLTWTKLKWQYQQEVTFEGLQYDILWIAMNFGV